MNIEALRAPIGAFDDLWTRLGAVADDIHPHSPGAEAWARQALPGIERAFDDAAARLEETFGEHAGPLVEALKGPRLTTRAALMAASLKPSEHFTAAVMRKRTLDDAEAAVRAVRTAIFDQRVLLGELRGNLEGNRIILQRHDAAGAALLYRDTQRVAQLTPAGGEYWKPLSRAELGPANYRQHLRTIELAALRPEVEASLGTPAAVEAMTRAHTLEGAMRTRWETAAAVRRGMHDATVDPTLGTLA